MVAIKRPELMMEMMGTGMSDNADNKPIEDSRQAAGFGDFGDDWISDIEEAIDFDSLFDQKNGSRTDSVTSAQTPEEEPKHSAFVDGNHLTEGGEGDPSVVDVEGLLIEVEDDSLEASPSMLTGEAVTTQILDAATLQKKRSGRPHRQESTAEGEQTQQAQFISLIMMRLFDDFDLLVIRQQFEEVCDLSKQFSRLGNMLSFCGHDSLLPLLAYILQRLPVSYGDADIGVMSVREFDGTKGRLFAEKGVEILNCLMYLLRTLAKHYPTFDMNRFAETLERLYAVFGAAPGEPSIEAPLPLETAYASVGGILTTRTFIKVARTIEACLVESLHYIESSTRYGNASGIEDAAKCLNSVSTIANEYKYIDLSRQILVVYELINVMPDKTCKPPQEVFLKYLGLADSLKSLFSPVLTEKKIAHFRELVSKQLDISTMEQPLSNRWETFIDEAAPLLTMRNTSPAEVRKSVGLLREMSAKVHLGWLEEQFRQFELHWDNYPTSCLDSFFTFASSLMGLQAVDLCEKDFEELVNPTMRVLFSRAPDARVPKAYSMIHRAKEFTELLFDKVDKPREIDQDRIIDILIDARNLECHSLERICEVLLFLLGRLPEDPEMPVGETLVSGIYLCSGLFEMVCSSLCIHVDRSTNDPLIRSEETFYEALLTLYHSPGQPREAVNYFLHQYLGDLISELQLVWANSSTPTSTEYYCALLRKILNVASVSEFDDVRRAVIAHIEALPDEDFVNTEVASLERQYKRILNTIRSLHLPEPMQAAGIQAQNFFNKIVSSLNLLLSMPACDDPVQLSNELYQLHDRLSTYGAATDFPPIIALLFDLHHMSSPDRASRAGVEGLLYWIFNIAHNVSPAWQRPDQADLEFIKAPLEIPTTLYQQQLEHARVLHEALKQRAAEDPVVWAHIDILYQSLRALVSYAPFGLDQVVINARNRCRYLKKNISIQLDTNGYPDISDTDRLVQDEVLTAAFVTVLGRLVHLLVNHAFDTTDPRSQIRIILQPFKNSCSASIVHNGNNLTFRGMDNLLKEQNIVLAPDDDLLEMIVSSSKLILTYPPANEIAFILPILKQFNAQLTITDQPDGYTSFFLTFHV